MSIFTGSGVALITPFNENNEINYDQVENLINYHIENGTDALVICGTTGEASTLSDVEHRALLKFAGEKINKRVPFIAGTGSNDTHHGIDLSKYAEEVGADALLCVTPYYNKTSQEGLYQHFKLHAQAVDIPIILYNVPGRTGMGFDIETVVRLAEIDNIVGLKEASGDMSYAMEIMRRTPDDFELYAGNDDITLPLLAIGAKGVISVIANIMPKETHDLCSLHRSGHTQKALNLQLQMNQVNNVLFSDVNPIPVKEAMDYLGFNVGPVRLPLYKMSQDKKDQLVAVLNTFKFRRMNG